MRFAIITFSNKLPVLIPPEIFIGDIPFKDISCWSLLRNNVVKFANRPAKTQPQSDIDQGFDDKLGKLVEDHPTGGSNWISCII